MTDVDRDLWILMLSLVVAISVAAAALFTTVAGAQTLTRDLCATVGNPYERNRDQREYCGNRTYPLVNEHSAAYGGTAYEYDIGGLTATVRIPPSSFDALTATEHERAAFGLPPQPPADSPEYATWHERLALIHFSPAPPEIISGPTKHYTPSETWAGYQATPHFAEEGHVEAAEVEYREPERPEGERCTQPEAEADFWVGIEDVAHELAQDGTEIGYNVEGEFGEAWWELIAPSEEATDYPYYLWEDTNGEWKTVDVYPGEEVYASVAYGDADRHSMDYFFQRNHGDVWAVEVAADRELLADEHADYIVESQSEALSAFSVVKMYTDVLTELSETWRFINAFPILTEIQMEREEEVTRDERKLAETKDLETSGRFEVHWRRCVA